VASVYKGDCAKFAVCFSIFFFGTIFSPVRPARQPYGLHGEHRAKSSLSHQATDARWISIARNPLSYSNHLQRISGSFEDAMLRRQKLDRKLAQAVDIACEQTYYDLDDPLERHLQDALTDADLILDNSLFNDAFQIVEDVVQIRRRQRIFEIARAFSVLIQSDKSAAPFASGGKARFETNVSMQTTLARLKSARAVLSASRVNDEIHNRIQNGLNAGSVNIIENNAVNRSVLTDGKNALFFNYRDDDVLRERLDLVCSHPRRAYELAQASLTLRDETPFRFGGFHNILELAQRPFPAGEDSKPAPLPSPAL
jgi:hypothetical protein